MAAYKEGDVITIDRDTFIRARSEADLIVDPDWYFLPAHFRATVTSEEWMATDDVMWIDIYLNGNEDEMWICPLDAVVKLTGKAFISHHLINMYQEG